MAAEDGAVLQVRRSAARVCGGRGQRSPAGPLLDWPRFSLGLSGAHHAANPEPLPFPLLVYFRGHGSYAICISTTARRFLLTSWALSIAPFQSATARTIPTTTHIFFELKKNPNIAQRRHTNSNPNPQPHSANCLSLLGLPETLAGGRQGVGRRPPRSSGSGSTLRGPPWRPPRATRATRAST